MTSGPYVEEDHDDEEMPRIHVSRRTLVLGSMFIVVTVALLYLLLPRISGVESTWHRIEDGDPWWIALGALFSVLSFGGYVLAFKGVYVPAGDPVERRLGFAESYQITMAGLAATRLFAAGGAGGLALTAWALRRAGMARRVVADRTIAFLVLTYTVYMLALVFGGLGLRYGLLPGDGPFAVTVVPAGLALVALAIAGAVTFVPEDVERRVERWAVGHGRTARLAARLSTVPATASAGIRLAGRHIVRGDLALIGAILYWAFNIAILWASFRAFGDAPPLAIIVMAYFVGMLGNLLPLPGGVGGVDGGMIGAFAAFGVAGGLALVAVLTYRVLAFWLPTVPGVLAYLQLRRTVAGWKAEKVSERSGGTAVLH